MYVVFQYISKNLNKKYNKVFKQIYRKYNVINNNKIQKANKTELTAT